MPINIIVDEIKGGLRTTAFDGDGWQRVVIVTLPQDRLHISHLDGDPNKIVLTLDKNANNPDGTVK